MKDFLGQEIAVGDKIVYPGRSGSTLWMNAAVLEEILPTGNVRVRKYTNKWGKPANKLVTLWGTSRVVVVYPPAICDRPGTYCGTK